MSIITMALRVLGGAILLCGDGNPADGNTPCCEGDAGSPCIYTLDCSAFAADPGGDSLSRLLSAGIGCSWRVETADSWIHPTPPTSHLSGGFNVEFTVDENEDPTNPRAGSVNIITGASGPAGDPICTIPVTQAANPANCSGAVLPTLILSGGPLTVDAAGNPIPTSSADPWDGVLHQQFPCNWNSNTGTPYNSWLGYQINGLFNGVIHVAMEWRFESSNGYYKKYYGSTPRGVYIARTLGDAPAPLQQPQTLTMS